MNLFVYNSKKEVNCMTAMLGAEIRNAIQNWRKENKLPIDFRVPTLYVYYTNEIIKHLSCIIYRCNHFRR